jgi:2-methylcitrate dehydratase PrpD
VIDLFCEMGGKREATILATKDRLPCLHACYVNAYLANVLDFDDTYSTISHPGSMVVPPALAVAEMLGLGGQRLLTAVVVAYEVSLRIATAIQPTRSRARQVWGWNTHQIFGAVTATCKLMDLDREHVTHAFGLAGVNAPVPSVRKEGYDLAERPFSWAKNNYGWAAMGGVLAAFLASKGFLGNRFILEGERGFWVMAGSDSCDFAALTSGLGDDYLICDTSFKPYAACRYTHTALDAVRTILSRERVDPYQVETVVVRTFSELRDNFLGEPENIIDAQFNLPYLVALEISGRSPSWGLSETDLHRDDVRDLARKVEVVAEPEADSAFFERRAMPSAVELHLAGGKVLSASLETPRGGPGQRMSREGLLEKFHRLVDPVWGPERAERFAETVRGLEEVEDIASLII